MAPSRRPLTRKWLGRALFDPCVCTSGGGVKRAAECPECLSLYVGGAVEEALAEPLGAG